MPNFPSYEQNNANPKECMVRVLLYATKSSVQPGKAAPDWDLFGGSVSSDGSAFKAILLAGVADPEQAHGQDCGPHSGHSSLVLSWVA